MTGEMQDDSWIARRWALILTIAVMFADIPSFGIPHPRAGRIS